MSERALGTVIQINSSAIAGLTSINGVSLTAETIDKTTLSSTGGYREFGGGFKDGGEVSISGYFEPSDTNGQVAMYTAFERNSQYYIWRHRGVRSNRLWYRRRP